MNQHQTIVQHARSILAENGKPMKVKAIREKMPDGYKPQVVITTLRNEALRPKAGVARVAWGTYALPEWNITADTRTSYDKVIEGCCEAIEAAGRPLRHGELVAAVKDRNTGLYVVRDAERQNGRLRRVEHGLYDLARPTAPAAPASNDPYREGYADGFADGYQRAVRALTGPVVTLNGEGVLVNAD